MCALAGVDPYGVINSDEQSRELLIEVAEMAHKLVEEASKKKK